MSLKGRKVAIVGTGLVGSSTAFSLLTQGICEELMLIDINNEKALGEVLDLKHGVEYLNKNMKVRTATYEECGDVDIIIITAGGPPSVNDRISTLQASAKIVESIVTPIMASGFKGHFIVISNPVDMIAYHVYKVSGLPKSHVIGTGTSLDSARLKNILGDIFKIDPRSIQAYSMGEHGDTQMVPWSHVYIGGKPIYKVIEDNREQYGSLDLEQIVKDTARAGWDVYNRKGTTYYGIATSAAAIVKAILNDENKIMPVSTLLEGEYGEYEVFTGVPAILNSHGVKDVVEINMTEDEVARFKTSNDFIRECIEMLYK